MGVLLVVAGLAMLIWTGFSYTRRENVVDVGPVHISADRQKTVTWPPYAGGVLVVVGVVVLAAGRNIRRSDNPIRTPAARLFFAHHLICAEFHSPIAHGKDDWAQCQALFRHRVFDTWGHFRIHFPGDDPVALQFA